MIRAELFRLLRSRAPWLVLLATLALFALAVIQQHDVAHGLIDSIMQRAATYAEANQDVQGVVDTQDQLIEEYRATFRPVMGAVLALGYMATGPGLLLAIVAATWIFGSEYSSNTMRLLLLRQPDRLRLIVAKLAVLLGLLAFLTVALALVLILELWVLDLLKPLPSLDAPVATLSLAPPVRLFTAWCVPLATSASIAVLAGIVTRSSVANLLTPPVLLLADFVVGRAAPATQTWTLSYNMWRGAAPYGFFGPHPLLGPGVVHEV